MRPFFDVMHVYRAASRSSKRNISWRFQKQRVVAPVSYKCFEISIVLILLVFRNKSLLTRLSEQFRA